MTPLIVFCLIMVKKDLLLFLHFSKSQYIYIDFLLKFTNCAIAIPFIFSARLIRFCVYCRTITLLSGQKHILHLQGGSNPYRSKYAGCTVLSLGICLCAEEERFLADCLELIKASRIVFLCYTSIRILIYCSCSAPNLNSVAKLYCK